MVTKRSSLQILALVLACGLGAFLISESAAHAQEDGQPETPKDTKALAERLHENLQESRKSLLESEAQKRKILASVYSIQQRMKKISRDKGQLTDDLFQTQDNVKNVAKLIANLEVQTARQRHHLRRRLRALYKLSGESYIGIMFSRTNIYDLDETLRFMKIVTENDYQQIRQYQENIRTYLAQKSRLRSHVERLVIIERNIKRQEGLLANEQSAKSKIIAEIDRERSAKLNKIKNLRSQTRALAEVSKPDGVNWDELLKPSIFEQKGQLPSPLRGAITQDFGLITDEKYKTRLSHKGWRIVAAAGSPVSSIFDGTVVHSSWMEGYGQTVIVDHGDHYYSVYAHIARSRVKTGDILKRGQVLAEAGRLNELASNSDHGSGDGIYFEIRHFSEPENPAVWIAGQELRKLKIDTAKGAFASSMD